MISESYEAVLTDDLIENLEALTKYATTNDNAPDVTDNCYSLFSRIAGPVIRTGTLTHNHNRLTIVETNIRLLTKCRKFDNRRFVALLFDEFLTLPLRVLWWLHKNNILYFGQYW